MLVRVPQQIFLIFIFSGSPLIGGSFGSEIVAGIRNLTCVPFCSSVLRQVTLDLALVLVNKLACSENTTQLQLNCPPGSSTSSTTRAIMSWCEPRRSSRTPSSSSTPRPSGSGSRRTTPSRSDTRRGRS